MPKSSALRDGNMAKRRIVRGIHPIRAIYTVALGCIGHFPSRKTDNSRLARARTNILLIIGKRRSLHWLRGLSALVFHDRLDGQFQGRFNLLRWFFDDFG